MNLKADYKRLYQLWLKEFEQIALTRLTQEDFNYFSKTVNYTKKFELEDKQEVKLQLFFEETSFRHFVPILFLKNSRVKNIKCGFNTSGD